VPNAVVDAQAANIMLQMDGRGSKHEVLSDKLHPTCNASPISAFIMEDLKTYLYKILYSAYEEQNWQKVDKLLEASDVMQVPLGYQC
jgi:hypothetical protein